MPTETTGSKYPGGVPRELPSVTLIRHLEAENERLRGIIGWCRRRLSTPLFERYVDRMVSGDWPEDCGNAE